LQRKVDFHFVYIAEAHASDEWPIQSSRFNKNRAPVSYKQPTTSEERTLIIRDFVQTMNLQMNVLLDVVEKGDQFERLYAPWPLRFYVIKRNEMTGKRELIYYPSPKNCGYDIAELRSVLLEHC
jgi:hypothetical protein